VVFRGFFPNNNALMFVSDGRSQKVEDVAIHPLAEACWYFTETREQFRLSGSLVLVDGDSPGAFLQQVRQRIWAELSDQSKLQFYWPQPGQKRTENAARFTDPNPDPATPPDVFCLGLLMPTAVDHLELRGKPQNRYHYRRIHEEDWQQVEINP
jgi:PPOX class probable FMN-dependent enzyme